MNATFSDKDLDLSESFEGQYIGKKYLDLFKSIIVCTKNCQKGINYDEFKGMSCNINELEEEDSDSDFDDSILYYRDRSMSECKGCMQYEN